MSPDDRIPLASRRAVVFIILLTGFAVILALVLTAGPERPFEYSADEQAEFESAAAAGHSHLLYANSPGGSDAEDPARSGRG
jgi:hypothetical protein